VFEPDKFGGWVVTLDGQPSVRIAARTLTGARAAIAAAAALWAHIDASEVRLSEELSLPVDDQALVDEARNQRRRADIAWHAAQRSTQEAVHRLVANHSLSIRDTAAIVGISYSRVAQLLRQPSSASQPSTR
jgi:hypothetical protein